MHILTAYKCFINGSRLGSLYACLCKQTPWCFSRRDDVDLWERPKKKKFLSSDGVVPRVLREHARHRPD